mmetsp:Transcript_91441/g.244854  ORF Transcript_91441/g.244854 Transcript_91441/m.244854 type:complete len:234 (+) Transcript_91441:434-1135(+)
MRNWFCRFLESRFFLVSDTRLAMAAWVSETSCCLRSTFRCCRCTLMNSRTSLSAPAYSACPGPNAAFMASTTCWARVARTPTRCFGKGSRVSCSIVLMLSNCSRVLTPEEHRNTGPMSSLSTGTNAFLGRRRAMYPNNRNTVASRAGFLSICLSRSRAAKETRAISALSPVIARICSYSATVFVVVEAAGAGVGTSSLVVVAAWSASTRLNRSVSPSSATGASSSSSSSGKSS